MFFSVYLGTYELHIYSKNRTVASENLAIQMHTTVSPVLANGEGSAAGTSGNDSAASDELKPFAVFT